MMMTDTLIRGFKRISKANGWSEGKQMALLPAPVGDAHEWLAQELEDETSLATVELMCCTLFMVNIIEEIAFYM